MLIIQQIEKTENRIVVRFSTDDEWAGFIKEASVENIYDENIEQVPDSIAAIPALCNLLPIAWTFDLKIHCPEMDDEFMKAVPEIRAGYQKMYPDMKFGGELTADRTVRNTYDASRCAVLFSGGVDATVTAFRHMDEKPDIVTVLGADIKLTDKEGIKNVNEFNSRFSDEHHLQYERIYSAFRTFIHEWRMTQTEALTSRNLDWYHDFQHGIGLIGLVAPLSYVRGYKTVYIASSYHESQWGQYKCASDPVIDNRLKYGATCTFHDGYELTRQEKVRYICDYADQKNVKPFLRVCWESGGGKNCCHCEKCRRTYMAVLAEKHDPADFGLAFTKTQVRRMIKWYKRHLPYSFDRIVLPLYADIQKAFVRNYKSEEIPKELKWLWDVRIGEKPFSKMNRLIDKVEKKLGME